MLVPESCLATISARTPRTHLGGGLDTTVVIEARPSGAGAEDEEDEVVGEMGVGEDEDNDKVDEQRADH